MKIICNNEKLIEELQLILNLFFNKEEQENLSYEFKINTSVENLCVSTQAFVVPNNLEITNKHEISKQEKENISKYVKRYAKITFYELLEKLTNKTMPYGSLTGIRPTKLFYELKDKLGSGLLAKQELIKTFKVSKEKAELIYLITQNQKCIIKNDKLVDLYINLPFCTSRCYYCSFISANINACAHLVEPYVDALIKEITAVKNLINKKNLIVKTIYIGGGTPTAFSAEQLDRILNELNFNVNEFTVEAGRPDTITKEKLEVLHKHNVTRISINPQSFNDKTLKAIGRNHTTKDIIEAYKMALPFNFKINMDLIAGLNGETFNNFKKSLLKTLEFEPNNITIHTLSIKRGSNLKENGGNISNESEVVKMVDFAYKKLLDNGYSPYYMYKQKNMLGNLENIGYTKPNCECVFNIDSMEEVASVIACGANGISKRYYSNENRIERCANVKDIKEYITRIDEMIERKAELFE